MQMMTYPKDRGTSFSFLTNKQPDIMKSFSCTTSYLFGLCALYVRLQPHKSMLLCIDIKMFNPRSVFQRYTFIIT